MITKVSNTPLIKTKFNRRRTNQYLIPRKQLYIKLNNAFERKLTLVTTPAGYGKTTAVLDWLNNCKSPSAWLSIDSYDNDPAVFWRYICISLENVVSNLCRDMEYVFSSNELLKANIQISILIDRLLEIESDFFLVLDDFHLIGNPVIINGISCLINYLPPSIHVILISRTEPVLEYGGSSIIKWQPLRIRKNDLRFRGEEIYSFYKARGLELVSDEVQKIEDHTEGWAAALVAIALCFEDENSRDIVSNISCSGSSIDKFIGDEVIGTLPLDERDFLLKTSILDTLCEDICSTITGLENGGLLLRKISKKNEFLVPLDEERHVYRYHPLFKDYLYRLLLESDAQEVLNLNKKAAIWYRDKSYINKAIEHFLRGERYEDALGMIEKQIKLLAVRNDYDTALTLIERLPEEYKDRSRSIAAFYALYYAEAGSYESSAKWIEKLKEIISSGNSTGVQAAAYEGLPEWISLNLLLREGRLEEMCSVVSGIEAAGYKQDKTMEFFDFNKSDIYFYRCPISKLSDFFRRNKDEFTRIISMFRRTIFKNPGYAPLAAGEYYYENNKMEEALPYLVEALEEAQASGCFGALVPVMVDLARIKRACGDIEGAFSILNECKIKLQEANMIYWSYVLDAFRVRLYIDTGELEKVNKWVFSSSIGIFCNISSFSEFELIVLARALIANNRFIDARLLLERLLIFTKTNSRFHSRVEVLNIFAELEYREGKISKAEKYMEESLVLGMAEGYMRCYIDELEPIVDVLRSAVSSLRKRSDVSKELKSYSQNVLKHTMEGIHMPLNINSGAPDRIRELLTEKEMEVLKLIFEANTNDEIGTELNIGIRTVKTHIGNIYSKLGIKNRAQCIKLVRDINLFN